MALLQCRECGHAVSEHADKCPNCGCPVSVGNISPANETQPAPQNSPKKGGAGKLLALLLVLVLVIAGIFFAIKMMNSGNEEPKDEGQKTEQNQDQTQEQNTEDQSNQTDDTEDYSDDEEYYEPGEDGGTEDDGAQGGQDVTDDNP